MTTLVKRSLHKSITENILQDIATRSSNYFFFMGKPAQSSPVTYKGTWDARSNSPSVISGVGTRGDYYEVAYAGASVVDGISSWAVGDLVIFNGVVWEKVDALDAPKINNVYAPSDSSLDEHIVRNNIIAMKQVKPADCCGVVRRIDWTPSKVYDRYDDAISSRLAGINLIDGGYGYTVTPTVDIRGGNGVGAYATCIINDQGSIIDVTLTDKGYGYTDRSDPPTITFSKSPIRTGGRAANAVPVFSLSSTGKTNLQECDFYVMNADYNVYKCIDNNNGAVSRYAPYGISFEPVTLADGYVWKFMYNIPVVMRNKFLTSEYMPVFNTLTKAFYDGGHIGECAVQAQGSGYTYATIKVDGDGHRENNKILVDTLRLTATGSGYSSDAKIVFDAPYTNYSYWSSGLNVIVGQILLSAESGYFYKTIVGGKLGTIPPYHRAGMENNGTVVLEYIGEMAKANCIVSGGQITKVDLVTSVFDVQMQQGGSGYISTPKITLQGSSDLTATAYAKMYGDAVIDVVVTNSGAGYISSPAVIIGKQWTPSTQLTVNEQVFYANNLYTVTRTGITGKVYPTHKVGSATNGTVVLKYAGIAAKANVVMASGRGYNSVPTAVVQSFSGTGADVVVAGGKTNAKLVPIIRNGSIKGVYIANEGTGYSYASLKVIGDGTNANIVPVFFSGDITSSQGYAQLYSVPGAIYTIPLTSKGYGYSSYLPTVEVVGDGTGAQAYATLDKTGNADSILKIGIDNPGRGYSWADVILRGGSGVGAKARAIVSPAFGHSKDPLTELFCNKVMMYTNLNNQWIYGHILNNSYTQVGIIKDPTDVRRTFISGDTYTPCVVVSGGFDASKFAVDMEVHSTSDRKYTIVSIGTNSMILRANGNAAPTVGEYIDNQKSGGDFSRFYVESAIAPQIDKFSGDMLYVETQLPFTPSERETVVMRTVLTF